MKNIEIKNIFEGVIDKTVKVATPSNNIKVGNYFIKKDSEMVNNQIAVNIYVATFNTKGVMTWKLAHQTKINITIENKKMIYLGLEEIHKNIIKYLALGEKKVNLSADIKKHQDQIKLDREQIKVINLELQLQKLQGKKEHYLVNHTEKEYNELLNK